MHIATIFPPYSALPLAPRGVEATLTMSNSAEWLNPTSLLNAPAAVGGATREACQHERRTRECGRGSTFSLEEKGDRGRLRSCSRGPVRILGGRRRPSEGGGAFRWTAVSDGADEVVRRAAAAWMTPHIKGDVPEGPSAGEQPE